MNVPDSTVLFDAHQVERALERMSREILAFATGSGDLVLVGVRRRGAELAERIGRMVEAVQGAPVPIGALDITLYRDDLETVGPKPLVGETNIPAELEGKCVVIVDDVLYTGRTVRAALNELADFGRPARVGLAVLIDRGGRELPIQADVVGHVVDTDPADRVDVLITELDGRDSVELVKGSAW